MKKAAPRGLRFKMLRILVTGGSGYIGACIGETLAGSGYEVYLGSRSIAPSRQSELIKSIKTDWSDANLSFCSSFDVIIHAAGMDAAACAASPEEAASFNGEMTKKLVDSSIKGGCTRFFYLSTAHVYRSPLVGKIDEQSQLLNKHPYATSHALGERALIDALRGNRVNGAVLRLSNCFGPPSAESPGCWKLALNEFALDAVIRKKVIINNNPLAQRDFFPVSDVGEVLKFLIELEKPSCPILNICTGKSRTLMSVATEVARIASVIVGGSVKVECKQDSAPEQELTLSNGRLAKLGFCGATSISEELERLVAYCNSSLN